MDSKMNMPDPQAFANAWMAQISDPNQWQSWFKMMPEMDAVPGAALLRDAGATVRPEAMEQLRNEYMGEFGALWQEFLTTGKAPSLKDRRFSSEAWQGNPVSAFNAASYLLNS